MIEVSVREDGIVVTGHAGYAEAGKDIVCAGVSTLFQTMLKSIGGLTTDKIEYDIVPGASAMRFRNLSEKSKTLVDSFYIGVVLIAEEYPGYVKVI